MPRLSKETNGRGRLKKHDAGLRGNSMKSKQRSRRLIRTALIVLCLMPLLNGCASDPVIQTQVELQRVPAALLVPCPISSLGDSTYQGAIELALTLRGELVECNRRLDDIRSWSQR